jgi:arylsulfatase A
VDRRFNNERVAAVRTARWKLVVGSHCRGWDLPIAKFGYPLLFHTAEDREESYNMAARHPDVLADMKARVKRAQAL